MNLDNAIKVISSSVEGRKVRDAIVSSLTTLNTYLNANTIEKISSLSLKTQTTADNTAPLHNSDNTSDWLDGWRGGLPTKEQPYMWMAAEVIVNYKDSNNKSQTRHIYAAPVLVETYTEAAEKQEDIYLPSEISLLTMATAEKSAPDKASSEWQSDVLSPTEDLPYVWGMSVLESELEVGENTTHSKFLKSEPVLLSEYKVETKFDVSNLSKVSTILQNRRQYTTDLTSPSPDNESNWYIEGRPFSKDREIYDRSVYLYEWRRLTLTYYENGELKNLRTEPLLASTYTGENKSFITFLTADNNGNAGIDITDDWLSSNSYTENALETPTEDKPYLWLASGTYKFSRVKGAYYYDYGKAFIIDRYTAPTETPVTYEPVSVKTYTLLTADKTAPDSTAEWLESTQAATSDKPYLWQKVTNTYSVNGENVTLETAPVIVDTYTAPAEKSSTVTPKEIHTYFKGTSEPTTKVTIDDTDWTEDYSNFENYVPYDAISPYSNNYDRRKAAIQWMYTKAVYDIDGVETVINSKPIIINRVNGFSGQYYTILSKTDNFDEVQKADYTIDTIEGIGDAYPDTKEFYGYSEIALPTEEYPYVFIIFWQICYGSGSTSKGSLSKPILTGVYQKPAGESTFYETVSDAVTAVEMNATKYIILESAVTNLAITVGTTEGHAAYLRFTTGETAETITYPTEWHMPADFDGFEASTTYEITCVDGYISVQGWS